MHGPESLLDPVNKKYVSTGVHDDRLKLSAPCDIDIDLTAIDQLWARPPHTRPGLAGAPRHRPRTTVNPARPASLK
ncbi:hypothetical protein ACFU8Q_00540 [Streptomyces sp. NPDC057543]|uniref:hypothetical protein n=1 Tax=Streptomyces sp. NPDC057543 TaxID=3346163 RepID=UPI0036CFEFC7